MYTFPKMGSCTSNDPIGPNHTIYFAISLQDLVSETTEYCT